MIYARIKTQNWDEYETEHALLEDKLYPISMVYGHTDAFVIIDEKGREVFCLVNGCAHLGFGDWELIEVE